MGAVSKWVAIAGLLAVASACPAQAQTTGGYLLPGSGGTLTVSTGLGGWSFAIVGCVETLNSVTNQSCANSEVIPTLVKGTLSLAFVSSTGGALESSAPGFSNDITFTVNLTGPVTGIQSASLAIAGIAASQAYNDLTRISAGTTITTEGTGGAIQPGQTVNLSGPIMVSQVFTPIAPSISVSVDLRDQGAGIHGSAPGTSTLSSGTLTFNAPEPVSSSLLAVGAIGLAFVRRKKRRPS